MGPLHAAVMLIGVFTVTFVTSLTVSHHDHQAPRQTAVTVPAPSPHQVCLIPPVKVVRSP